MATEGEPSAGGEVVVVRLEGLGTFAVPVEALEQYRVVERSEPIDVGRLDPAAVAAPPLILSDDYLRGWSDRPDGFLVDGFGALAREDEQPLFGDGVALDPFG